MQRMFFEHFKFPHHLDVVDRKDGAGDGCGCQLLWLRVVVLVL